MMAVDYLYSKGRRCIGGAFAFDTKTAVVRYDGVIHRCTELGLSLASDRFYSMAGDIFNAFVDKPATPGYSNFKPNVWLDKPFEIYSKITDISERCDALICDNDIEAYIIVDVLLQAGKRIPEDIAIISFDNTFLCDLSPVSISSFDFNPKKLTRIATEKVRNMLDGKLENSCVLPWVLVPRNSTE